MPSGCLRCVTKEIVGRPSWFKNVKNMKCNKQQLICWLHLWIFMKCQKRCSKFMQNLAISGNLGLHLFSCWFKNVKNMKCNKQQLICWLHLWIFMKCQKRCSKFMQNLAISGNLGLHLFSCSCLGQGGKPKVDASKMPPRTRCLSDASEMLLRCL